MTGYSLENSGYKDHVWEYLWKQVRNSDCCCCESKFFCSSSTNMEKCAIGCCLKCKGIVDSESDLCASDKEMSDSSSDSDII